MLHLSINNKDVAFGINENIARNKVPYLVGVVALPRNGLHLLGYLQVALHVLRKIARVHWRLLRYGYFPHLALRHLLVELVEKCHDSSFF
jgi:hypothetical protein